MVQYEKSLCWFRRDLRADDHAALSAALRSSRRVWCVFVFDTDILDPLPDRADRRVEFIWEALRELDRALRALGGGLMVLHGLAREEIPALAARLGAQAVFASRDYEPAAVARDEAVARSLAGQGIAFQSVKDQVVFECDEVLTKDGRPFSVFTPYSRAWMAGLDTAALAPRLVAPHRAALADPGPAALPALEDIGFRRTDLGRIGVPTGMSGARRLFEDFKGRIGAYRERRDFPALKGPSYLSAHLRFGTISVRELARFARDSGGEGAETWLKELVWREFYSQLLWHHPRVAEHAFRPEFDAIPFPNDAGKFAAWCEGRTGYPLVDAAMRQLNRSGYMHNRLRMVAASFLVKDLHVDWRWGERYFARRLLDYDLASNNGGWQWAASTGCDAQPWFRIFNPLSQSKKFDPGGNFIRRYVPELAGCGDDEIHDPWTMSPGAQRSAGVELGVTYPAPIVDHAAARKLTLELYNRAKR
ncbi:MAG TPA: deoxyribodipyrimidine photo-lyase [Burkholderiales bacterium]|nr:deoxyribodipyrimidine photo-lyase [Burkholderiales bacterium]